MQAQAQLPLDPWCRPACSPCWRPVSPSSVTASSFWWSREWIMIRNVFMMVLVLGSEWVLDVSIGAGAILCYSTSFVWQRSTFGSQTRTVYAVKKCPHFIVILTWKLRVYYVLEDGRSRELLVLSSVVELLVSEELLVSSSVGDDELVRFIFIFLWTCFFFTRFLFASFFFTRGAFFLDEQMSHRYRQQHAVVQRVPSATKIKNTIKKMFISSE